MIKVKVIEKFNLNETDYNNLVNLKRASIDVKGKLFVNDEFECTETLAKYLSGENKYNKPYIEVIEVDNTKMPKLKEEIETPVETITAELKIKPKKITKKKTSKK